MAPPPGWSARLNRHFAGHARILGRPREIVVTDAGPFPVPSSLRSRIARARPAVNEGHGILANGPVWTRRRAHLEYRRTDYRLLQALRMRGDRPAVLSASALLIAPRERALILHHRSARNGHYKEGLHTIGGSFTPGDASLTETMAREVWEETRQHPREGTWPTLLVEETRTGFIQALFLGVEVATASRRRTPEGSTVPLSFDALPAALLPASPWVPSGKLAVLAWLALGAPGAEGARFAGKSAGALFRASLERPARDYPDP